MYASVTVLSVMLVLMAPKFLRAMLSILHLGRFLKDPDLTNAMLALPKAPRYMHQNIRSLQVPDRCRSTDFTEPGWVFHSSSDLSSRHTGSVNSPTQSEPERPVLQMLASQSVMSQACADLWIANSTLCDEIQQNRISIKEVEIDVAWSFVEPTEHWKRWKNAYLNGDDQFSRKKGTRESNFRLTALWMQARKFADLLDRTHDQLRYSVRSVLSLLPFVRKAILLSASMPSTGPRLLDNPGQLANYPSILRNDVVDCRVMQSPAWLNASMALAKNSRVQLLSHWDMFKTAKANETEAWRRSVLPVFNRQVTSIQPFPAVSIKASFPVML